MKLPSKPKFTVITLLGVFVFGIIFAIVPTVQAATASLSLSPGIDSVEQSKILSIGIYVNAGEPVNAVEANLTYPASTLDFAGIETSQAFSVAAASSGGNGSVHIERGALPAVSGRQLVATVKFKAKASTGSAKIDFASSSKVVSEGEHANILSGAVGGNYSFKAAKTDAPTGSGPLKKELNKIPEGRLEGEKLRYCQSRERFIKNTMARIADRVQKQFNLYTSIYGHTKALYVKKGGGLSNYDTLTTQADSSATVARLVLNGVKSSATSFKCDGDNPKAVLINFKEKLAIEIDALNAYRTSVKYLLLGVKKLGPDIKPSSGSDR